MRRTRNGEFPFAVNNTAHGIRGELFVRLFNEQADWLSKTNELALLPEAQANLKIFTISSFRKHKAGFISQFKEIPDRNAAEILRRAAVYVREEVLLSTEPDVIYLHQIDGFAVVDPSGQVLGQIEGFASNGPQDLLRLKVADSGREALVPFVPAFIVDIDFDNKRVRMDLPPGLLDVL